MNNTKEYIKMNEKADKYLEYQFEDGDLYVCICYGNQTMYESSIKDVSIVGHWKHPNINASAVNLQKAIDRIKPREALLCRIHRQDQLQEMMMPYGNKGTLAELIVSFGANALDSECAYRTVFPTMEQIWLAFVMFKKFKKLWNGKEWVN